MSQNYGKLAQRYAKALLRAVENEQGREGTPTPAQRVAQALAEFAGLWSEVPELSGSLVNPMFAQEERCKALLEIARRAEIPDVAQRFVRLVFERDRIAAFPAIAEAFAELADESAGVQQVVVTVARDISDNESRDIESQLSERIGGNLEFSWSVDPSILGGMVVRYSGKVLDGSLGGKLDRLERQLMN